MSRSVRIVGWTTALCSILIILSDSLNVVSNPMEQFTMVSHLLPQTTSGTDSLVEMFQVNRIWSVYSIFYFLYVLAGTILFIQFRAIGRMMLEIACWIGLVNAGMDSYLSFLLWKQMEATLSAAAGTMGMSLGNLSPLGWSTIVIGFFLWTIPSLGMIVYLRIPGLKALMK